MLQKVFNVCDETLIFRSSRIFRHRSTGVKKYIFFESCKAGGDLPARRCLCAADAAWLNSFRWIPPFPCTQNTDVTPVNSRNMLRVFEPASKIFIDPSQSHNGSRLTLWIYQHLQSFRWESLAWICSAQSIAEGWSKMLEEDSPSQTWWGPRERGTTLSLRSYLHAFALLKVPRCAVLLICFSCLASSMQMLFLRSQFSCS